MKGRVPAPGPVIALLLLALLLLSPSALQAARIITTIAGTGAQGFSGDGGPATAAKLDRPAGVFADVSGTVYISDWANSRVRKVEATTGIITTVAGTGVQGFDADGNAADTSKLNYPVGLFGDAAGNLYIADRSNHRIREVVAASGLITTVVGTGVAGYSGDAGTPVSARINSACGFGIDPSGTRYIADQGNNCIRKVEATTGLMSTVAGTGVLGYSGDGNSATNAKLSAPAGMVADASGTLYIADTGNHRIRKVYPDSLIICTVAGTGVLGFVGEGTSATCAQLNSPSSVCLDAAGDLLISDTGNSRIRKLALATGIITTVAGTGFPGYSGDGELAVSAQVRNPGEIYAGAAGEIYVADFGNNCVRKIFDDAPPVTPLQPSGPAGGAAGTGLVYSTAATDPDLDQVKYGWDWDGDGTVDEWSSLMVSGSTDNRSHTWVHGGPVSVQVRAMDEHGALSGWSTATSVAITSNPPATPAQPAGPATGTTGDSLSYSASAADPEGDQVRYGWDWNNDGTVDEWSGFVASGTADSRAHVWAIAGTYSVQVKAEDAGGAQSGWSPALAGITIKDWELPAPLSGDRMYVFPHPLKCPGGNAVFVMEKAGKAVLKIINMRGQVVKEISGDLAASPRAILPILCKDVSNGSYLIRGERKYVDGKSSPLKPYRFVVSGKH
jgi:sugar lactone lactonase YvrE